METIRLSSPNGFDPEAVNRLETALVVSGFEAMRTGEGVPVEIWLSIPQWNDAFVNMIIDCLAGDAA